MGLFTRKTQVEKNLPAAPESAPGGMTQTMADHANVAIDKAASIYNKNPKLIGGLAAVAGAILLSRMKRTHH